MDLTMCSFLVRRPFTSLLAAAALAPALAPALARSEPLPAPAPHSLPTLASATSASGIRIVALRTGWVGVKQQHRELTVPRLLALPAIMLGQAWADWMPIVVYAIVHPERTILVDTGPSPRINEPDYYACDQRSKFFYRRNLRFAVPAGDTLGPRLAQAGIDAKSVSDLVVTHFHADHVGGIDVLPSAKLYTGPGNWPVHVGAFTCRLPAGVQPTTPRYEDVPVVGIGPSMALTADGKVRIVALPGHTPGHVGVSVTDGGRTWLIVGDATFDQDQSERGAVTGVSQDFDQAVATQRLLAQAARRADVVVLPAHDPTVFSRLK
jgi:N-acyl homoserine lactone hydrolase